MNRTLALAFAAAIAAAWLLGAASVSPAPSCESAGAGAPGEDPPLDFLFASQDDWRRIELEQALADPRPAGK